MENENTEFIEQEESQIEETEVVDESPAEESEVEEVEETKDQKAERAQSQIDRLKKERDEAKAKLAKYESGDKKENVSSSDDALLARLENRGVLDPQEQEYVIKFAKVEGISPIEALNEEVVKDKLAFFKRQREAKASTMVAPNRTGGKVDEVEKWVARYKKDGSLPDSPALVSKVLDRLRGL